MTTAFANAEMVNEHETNVQDIEMFDVELKEITCDEETEQAAEENRMGAFERVSKLAVGALGIFGYRELTKNTAEDITKVIAKISAGQFPAKEILMAATHAVASTIVYKQSCKTLVEGIVGEKID